MSLQTQTVPRTRVRFFILSLLTIGTMINYLDRTVLGIAAPSLTKELGFSAATMGIVFSAFSWTYAAMQIPDGIFLDRFGTKLTYFLSLTFWSLATLLHGLATNLASLLSLRFRQLAGICIGQFAGNSTLVFFLTWFPTYLATERHMGWLKIGFFTVLPFIAASVGVLFGGWWSASLSPRPDRSSVR